MTNIFRFFFPSNKPPIIGKIYVLDVDRENPFSRDRTTVIVREIKNGWVRYNYTHGSVILPGSESKTFRQFNWIYVLDED